MKLWYNFVVQLWYNFRNTVVQFCGTILETVVQFFIICLSFAAAHYLTVRYTGSYIYTQYYALSRVFLAVEVKQCESTYRSISFHDIFQ